jgi:far upstream element-binding protein
LGFFNFARLDVIWFATSFTSLGLYRGYYCYCGRGLICFSVFAILQQIPDRDVGLCIGRQGCVIREMQHKTNTRIQIPSQPTLGQPHRTATVVGTQDGCNLVQGLIDRIINEQSSACVMSGTPYHNQQGGGQYHNGQQQQQQQQQQQAYGQPQQGQEYSAEWQAYYAAQALTKQAAAPATAAAPAATAQGADAYYEQFFRYAYYYGEDPAREYYGAWSPPPGTPNPYGVNPAGITAAPAQQGTPAAVLAPAYSQAPAAVPVAVSQQQQQQVRDSSVRKVSNLPAWMTRGN